MKERQKILHLVYGIVLTLLIISSATLLIGTCITIYALGAFNVGALALSFIALFLPLSFCLIAIFIGDLLHAIFPGEKEKIEADVNSKTILKNLYRKVDLRKSPRFLVNVVKSQRRFRKAMLAVIIFNVLINLGGAVYSTFFTNLFKTPGMAENLLEIIPAILSVLAYTILPFISLIVYNVFANFTYEKELEAVTAIVKHNKEKGIIVTPKVKSRGKVLACKIIKKILVIHLQVFLVLGAITLMIIGAVKGELNELKTLAETICTFCIGIG